MREREVALIPIIKGHVPNEFVVRGYVVVGDHAAKPTGLELHSDVPSDEVMKATGLARARERRVGRGWAEKRRHGGDTRCSRRGG